MDLDSVDCSIKHKRDTEPVSGARLLDIAYFHNYSWDPAAYYRGINRVPPVVNTTVFTRNMKYMGSGSISQGKIIDDIMGKTCLLSQPSADCRFKKRKLAVVLDD